MIIKKVTVKSIYLMVAIIYLMQFSACTEERIDSNRKNITTLSHQNDIQSHNPTRNSKKYQLSLTENLYVDAEVGMPKVGKANILKVSDTIFDDKKLCKVFFQSKVYKNKKMGDGELFYVDDKKLSITEDKKIFDFSTSMKENTDAIVFPTDSANIQRFSSRELDFMSKKKAIEIAADLVKSLGITPHMSPRVLSIDYKSLEKEQRRRLKEDGFQEYLKRGLVKIKDHLSKDDEFYYILFPIDMYGIPCDISSYTDNPSGIPVDGSQIQIMISKNGIEHCQVNGIVYHEVGVKGNALPLISVDQAINSIKKKYENIILTDLATITNITLVYEPVLMKTTKDENSEQVLYKEIELVPTWLFEIRQRPSSSRGDMVSESIVRINAINGEEIF